MLATGSAEDGDGVFVDVPVGAPGRVLGLQEDEEDEIASELAGLALGAAGFAGEDRSDSPEAAAIEMSAGGGAGPGGITVPTDQVCRLLSKQEKLRDRLQLLEKKRELQDLIREKELLLQQQMEAQRAQGSNHQREYQYLCRIGKGSFWNIRGRFAVVGGLLNIGTHMSVAQRTNGRFIVIDTISLPPPALAELKHLTRDGELIDAVIATHPYHTLAFPAFFKEFPTAPYYGTPRHLSVMPEIPWKGEVMAMKEAFAPDLECRIPAGAEYILPLPARTNHLSNVFVLHKQVN
jgi:hypothetical protein